MRGGSGNQIVLYNGTPGANGYGLAVSNGACGSGSTLYLVLGGVSCNAINGGTMPLNTWRHVVVSRTPGGTWSLYVNGVSQGTSLLAPLTPTGSTAVSPASNPVNARIDEVAVYKTSLAAALVQAHHQRATQTVTKTTRFLLGGLFETDGAGTITLAEVAGPEGDLARYSGPPAIGTAVNFLYWNTHGDLAAQANTAGVRQAAYSTDPFGASTQISLPGNAATERFTGRWNKKLDTASGLIEMGARPYDPILGRFLAADSVEGGSANIYDYSMQDPVNIYDLTGTRCRSFLVIAFVCNSEGEDEPVGDPFRPGDECEDGEPDIIDHLGNILRCINGVWVLISPGGHDPEDPDSFMSNRGSRLSRSGKYPTLKRPSHRMPRGKVRRAGNLRIVLQA